MGKFVIYTRCLIISIFLVFNCHIVNANSKIAETMIGVPAVDNQYEEEQKKSTFAKMASFLQNKPTKTYTNIQYQIKEINKNIKSREARDDFIKKNPKAKIVKVGGLQDMEIQAQNYTDYDAKYNEQVWNERNKKVKDNR